MLNQFSRTQLLLGRPAIERLADCRVAVFGVEEGATMVRVGTAIFGKRNYQKI